MMIISYYIIIVAYLKGKRRQKREGVSVKFSSVIHLTVDDYYRRGFGFISISV